MQFRFNFNYILIIIFFFKVVIFVGPKLVTYNICATHPSDLLNTQIFFIIFVSKKKLGQRIDLTCSAVSSGTKL